MKTLKIVTACATLALALSACGSSTEAAKTEESGASATETSTSNSFAVSSSSASARESEQASASPTESVSSSSASASASHDVTSSSAPLPADMTISAEKAGGARPDGIAQFEKDGAQLEDSGSSKGSQKYMYHGDNPRNYTNVLVSYLPGSDYQTRTSGLDEKHEMGNGMCGMEHESDSMRSEKCYFPVADGGVLMLAGTVDKTRTDGIEVDTQRIHDFAAEFVNQIKN
ncbi:hypothetical protein ACN082_03605 [Rothia sp. CCM 9417]|uniref:hypothetical protein n=1 Tax=unclassified Rothia (in: high G+C Gram-positive bacteria) TaxID=2689056 RepID=UPI003ADEE1B6